MRAQPGVLPKAVRATKCSAPHIAALGRAPRVRCGRHAGGALGPLYVLPRSFFEPIRFCCRSRSRSKLLLLRLSFTRPSPRQLSSLLRTPSSASSTFSFTPSRTSATRSRSASQPPNSICTFLRNELAALLKAGRWGDGCAGDGDFFSWCVTDGTGVGAGVGAGVGTGVGTGTAAAGGAADWRSRWRFTRSILGFRTTG